MSRTRVKQKDLRFAFDIVSASMPTENEAWLRRIAAPGRSHNSGAPFALRASFCGSGLARDRARNEAGDPWRPPALTRRFAPPSPADAGEGHIETAQRTAALHGWAGSEGRAISADCADD